MSLLQGGGVRWGWGAYMWDKNTSARLCAKNAGRGGGEGGLMREGGVYAGHYSTKVRFGVHIFKRT